ncbi:trypsin-like peptidase domain-containing protein [Planktothrix agardhii]|jgi:Trypsin-like serine proteases, typically periplasmic, contain C-terminal PDZ domain|uniref:HtrA n=2 Tax=Planktothrix agardhii TaxID=1160 RepID=A0A073CMP9_PLAA1|nr:trypsin-like peptidase domain-containing protein [Planktothrix agardhii]KEI69018.1 HtrA [Planktothrix agardhii NIVA-CYA 126/8]MCB8749392.1 trypsin-like peptidase domain-containing protein [Planktothrix agardhii 1810]MCB8766737.1 trypsin-like peptidase domain-containing protein [Planktothrix agardhii 1809]MCB8779736.1 trypsin-like peptidase domain-containing protein [Planktothrix agardhii 1031]MCB8784167.1 trypsin-like peptidase domain-containing protein [Planktothrix agardhii 1808]
MNFLSLRLTTLGLLTIGALIHVPVANANLSKTIYPVPPSSLPAKDLISNYGFDSPLILAADKEEEINIKVYENASPAVVSIDTKKTNGSGTIISPDGLVLTNAHVVSGGGTVIVTLADGRKLEAEVIAFGEPGLDLAVLKIRNIQNLPTIPIASPNSVKVGQRAFAIGNPFGQFQNTLTVGIVSRLDQNRNLIQTDAAINPGNSGGPLLNSDGELIGVNTAIFTRGQGGGNIGIGFAISVDRVPPFLQAVKEGRASRTPTAETPAFEKENAKQIQLNSPEVTDTLKQGDEVLPVDNSFYHVYAFEGKAGQQVTIEMNSNEIDSYLILLTEDGEELAQDDDGGGEKNAKITTTLPKDGTYLLLVNSYEAGEAGVYRLRLKATESSSNSETGQLILNEKGVLEDQDSVLSSDGSLYDEYTFEGKQGQSILIRSESQDFDSYLALFDPKGKLIAENDDASQSDKNAEIRVTLPVTGRYRVVVNAYDKTGRGQYLLTVR